MRQDDARGEGDLSATSQLPANAYDAIVVGGGQNGLAAAVRLAKAKKRVVVLERRETLGGLCAPVEIHPGYRVPGILHDEGLVAPQAVKALGLDKHGLTLRPAPAVFLAGGDGGRGLLVDRDPERASTELSRRDADAYRSYRAFHDRLRPLFEAVMTSAPPPLSPPGAGEAWRLRKHGMRFLRLGRKDTLELLRVAPMCVADYLNEHFEDPLLVEGLAAPAVTATFAGPWSAGTTTNLLLSEAAPGRHVVGGPAGLVTALEKAARAAGVELRTNAEVARLRVEDGRVVGVTLAAAEGPGEEVTAPLIVVTTDPKKAMLELVPAGTLPIRIEEEFRRVRMRGTAAKVHLALSGPLEIPARPGHLFEAIRIGGGHIDDLERAFDVVKYRTLAKKPHLDIRVPSLQDASLAPEGHHVASILVSYAPFDVERGWNGARRKALTDSVLAALDRHIPGARKKIVAFELLTPADLANHYALTGGQLHHGEPALDQLWAMRPTPSSARYATTVAGLFLGGSGSHGGGGVSCTAGWLAAEAGLSGPKAPAG